MNIHKFSKCFVFCILIIFGQVSAEVYKCPSHNGTVKFTDKPCPEGFRNKRGEWVSVKEEARMKNERREKLEREKIERDRQEKLERERIQRDRQERLEKERIERDRLAREHRKETKKLAKKGETRANSKSISMSFKDCLSRKTQVIASLGVNPRKIIPIVNTGIVTMDRVCTSDGSVLITCSKMDRKMVVTTSSASRDVGCR